MKEKRKYERKQDVLAPIQPPKRPEPIKLLRVDQVAYRLNVSESSVRRWCDHGHLVKVKFESGGVRITESSFEAFLKKSFMLGEE